MGTDERSITSWRRPAAASAVSLISVAVALAVLGIETAVEQAANPPGCYGIGFGCTLDAGATVAFATFIIGLPTVTVAWLATWIGWAATRRRSERVNRATAWWPAWLVAGATGVLAVSAVWGGS